MDKEEIHDPVYDIPCTDCSKSYIGETQRKFIARKGEHLLDIEIRQRTGHCMRRHVTSEREPCAFKKVMKLNS